MVRNFEFLEPGRFAVSASPDGPEAVDWLCDQGIRTVVSLHPIPDAARDRLRERGITWLDYPITDFSVGIPPGFRGLLKQIQERVAAEPAVLIHCQGGGGRSRTVYAALQVEDGQPANAVLTAIPGIEKDVQKAFLHGFAAGRTQ